MSSRDDPNDRSGDPVTATLAVEMEIDGAGFTYKWTPHDGCTFEGTLYPHEVEMLTAMTNLLKSYWRKRNNAVVKARKEEEVVDE